MTKTTKEYLTLAQVQEIKKNAINISLPLYAERIVKALIDFMNEETKKVTELQFTDGKQFKLLRTYINLVELTETGYLDDMSINLQDTSNYFIHALNNILEEQGIYCVKTYYNEMLDLIFHFDYTEKPFNEIQKVYKASTEGKIDYMISEIELELIKHAQLANDKCIIKFGNEQFAYVTPFEHQELVRHFVNLKFDVNYNFDAENLSLNFISIKF